MMKKKNASALASRPRLVPFHSPPPENPPSPPPPPLTPLVKLWGGADRVMVPKIMTRSGFTSGLNSGERCRRRNTGTSLMPTEMNLFSYYETDYEAEVENTGEQRESFTKVLRSAFLLIFLMQTLGCWLSLTFSSLMAFLDKKLDAGYKIGYLIAWILGGRGGILLTLCLSFASWVCGKTSCSVVVPVVVAMWVRSNLARYAPLQQGGLLTLLYMSIKLQVDLTRTIIDSC